MYLVQRKMPSSAPVPLSLCGRHRNEERSGGTTGTGEARRAGGNGEDRGEGRDTGGRGGAGGGGGSEGTWGTAPTSYKIKEVRYCLLGSALAELSNVVSYVYRDQTCGLIAVSLAARRKWRAFTTSKGTGCRGG